MLYSFDINEWNAKSIFKPKININEIVSMIKNYNNENDETLQSKQLEIDFKTLLNNLDHDSYLYLYCQLKKPERKWMYHPKQEFPITTTAPSLLQVTLKDTNDFTLFANKDPITDDQLKSIELKRFYLKSIYSVLICRSEKVYFVLIVSCIFIGSIFVVCGTIRIYISTYNHGLVEQNLASTSLNGKCNFIIFKKY